MVGWGFCPQCCLCGTFAVDGAAQSHLGLDSALAESARLERKATTRPLGSSNVPFLVELLPRWVCLGFSSVLLRFLGVCNYYLILGSGLNWLSLRIMVMQFPANVNFLHFALGGPLPLLWTPTEAESGSYCSGLSHMVWGTSLSLVQALELVATGF